MHQIWLLKAINPALRFEGFSWFLVSVHLRVEKCTLSISLSEHFKTSQNTADVYKDLDEYMKTLSFMMFFNNMCDFYRSLEF